MRGLSPFEAIDYYLQRPVLPFVAVAGLDNLAAL
jgi:hypothetical protein